MRQPSLAETKAEDRAGRVRLRLTGVGRARTSHKSPMPDSPPAFSPELPETEIAWPTARSDVRCRARAACLCELRAANRPIGTHAARRNLPALCVRLQPQLQARGPD